jgi:hypothetical protein
MAYKKTYYICILVLLLGLLSPFRTVITGSIEQSSISTGDERLPAANDIFGHSVEKIPDHLPELVDQYYSLMISKKEILLNSSEELSEQEIVQLKYLDAKIEIVEVKLEAKFHLVGEYGLLYFDNFKALNESEKLKTLEDKHFSALTRTSLILKDRALNRNESEKEINQILSEIKPVLQDWEQEIGRYYKGAYRVVYHGKNGLSDVERSMLQLELKQIKEKYNKKRQQITINKLPKQQKKQLLSKLASDSDSEVRKLIYRAKKLDAANSKKFNLRRSQERVDMDIWENLGLSEASQNQQLSGEAQSIEKNTGLMGFYELMGFQIVMTLRGHEIEKKGNQQTESDKQQVEEFVKLVEAARAEMARKYYFVWENGFFYPDMEMLKVHPELFGILLKLKSFLRLGAGIEAFKGITLEQKVTKLNQIMLGYSEAFENWQAQIEQIYQGKELEPAWGSYLLDSQQRKALEDELTSIEVKFEKEKLVIESNKSWSEDKKFKKLSEVNKKYVKIKDQFMNKAVAKFKDYRDKFWTDFEIQEKKYKEANGIVETADKPFVYEFYKNAVPATNFDLKSAQSVVPIEWMDPLQVTDPILKDLIAKNKDLRNWEIKVRRNTLITEPEKNAKLQEIYNEKRVLQQKWNHRQSQIINFADPRQAKVKNVILDPVPRKAGEKAELTAEEKAKYFPQLPTENESDANKTGKAQSGLGEDADSTQIGAESAREDHFNDSKAAANKSKEKNPTDGGESKVTIRSKIVSFFKGFFKKDQTTGAKQGNGSVATVPQTGTNTNGNGATQSTGNTKPNAGAPIGNDNGVQANLTNQNIQYTDEQLKKAGQGIAPYKDITQLESSNGLFAYDPTSKYNSNDVNPPAKGFLKIKYKDSEGKEQTQDIPLVITKSSKADLQATSPEQLAKVGDDFMREMQKSNSKGFVGKAVHLGLAPATFFTGVTLVTLLDLMTEYEHNPVRLYQHLVGPKDPVWWISFYMFMAASGKTQQVLRMFMHSPKAMARLPYLGMSVGMLASHFTSEAINAFRECGKELLSTKSIKKSYPVCQKNYNDFVITGKIIDMAPSLVSMLLATHMAGMIETTVKNRLTSGIPGKIMNFAMKVSGVDLLMSVGPGGAVVFGLKWAFKQVFQAFLFVKLQEYFDPWIIPPYQNVLKGANLDQVTNYLTETLVDAKNDKWLISENDCTYHTFTTNPYNLLGQPQEICDKSLIGNLKDFKTKMAAWRAFNLEKPMSAYMGWNQKIEKVGGMHGASRKFYETFLGEVQAAVENRMKPYPKIYGVAPYNGIKPYVAPEMAAQGADPSDGVERPIMLEESQRGQVYEAIKLIEDEFKSGGLYDKTKFPLLEEKRLASEAKWLVKIVADLRSKQTDRVITALTKIHDLKTNFSSLSNTGRMSDLLRKLVDFMGLPEPDMIPGRAYIHAFKIHPTFQMLFAGLEYPDAPARYVLKDPTDYFIHQMICGPDVERQDELVVDSYQCSVKVNKEREKAIEESKGLRDELLPPQIRERDDKVYHFCDQPETSATVRMYTDPLYVDTKEGRQVFKGPIDYLAHRTRASVLSGGFESWWNSGVTSQVENALDDYDVQYAKIAREFLKTSLTKTFSYQDKKLHLVVGGILEKLRDGNFDFFNAGPISNGAIYAIKQEARLYLMVLNEMLKDLWVPTLKKEELGKLLTTKQRYLKNNSFLNTYRENKLPLMIYFLHNEPFDLTRLVNSTPSYTRKYSGQPSDSMIASIESVSERFSEFFKAFEALDGDKYPIDQKDKLKTVKEVIKKVGEDIKVLREQLEGPLQCKSVFTDDKGAADAISAVNELVQSGSSEAPPVASPVQSGHPAQLVSASAVLTPAQQKLAVFCVEALEALQAESENYTRMLTFKNTDKENENMEQFLNKSKESTEKLKESIKKQILTN